MRFRRNKNGGFPSESEIESMNIYEYLDSLIDPFCYVEGHYGKLNEYYSGNIPSDVFGKFKKDPHKDYILENLQTHDSDLFVRKMIEIFKEYGIVDVSKTSGSRRYIKVLFPLLKSEDEICNFIDSDEFLNFVDFFGYTKSKISRVTGKGIVLSLEPLYAEDANNLVYKECGGIIYHISYGDKVNDILNSGLRIRTGRKDLEKYRDFPRRIYFLAVPRRDNVLRSDEMRLSVESYLDDSLVRKNGLSVFRVDVRDMNLNFYKDSASQDDDVDFAVYTYNDIPKERIKKIFEGTKDQLFYL